MTTIVLNNNNNKKNDYAFTSKGGEVNILEALNKSFERKPSRTYTPIGMSYATTFKRLYSKGALYPI